jgi:2-polyprenyl-6-methoxyphenol hydroxylase-like FAD-dependent oxidoreductase
MTPSSVHAPAGPRPPPPEVTILGGGIGGLTMANALQRVGIGFDLHEQAAELTEVGAGIGLSQGALALLDMLGLGESARAKGRAIRSIHLADRRLRIRRTLPPGYDGICIHRAALIELLRSRLPAERIHLSSRVTDVRSHADRAEVRFADGRSVVSPCVVAADGIHSVARRTLFPEIPIRYIDQTIWRGISRVDVPAMLRDSYVEVWDQGLRFLTVPIGEEETFWLAVKPAPPGGSDDPATVRSDLLELFRDFHPVFLELIRASAGFLRDDMADLGPPARRPWHHHRVAFVGDSIHATTPNLAQGGCQAMEDAVCLALQLRSRPADLEGAFRAYQRLRRRKVGFVVNTSWRFGVAAHSRNPLVHHAARMVLERSPDFLLLRQERFLSDVSYLGAMPPRDAATPAPSASSPSATSGTSSQPTEVTPRAPRYE